METVKNVPSTVRAIQNQLGHSCGYVLPPATGWKSLEEMAQDQRRAFEALPVDSLERRWYGIISWPVVDGKTYHESASGRLQIYADERQETVKVSCWSGPNKGRPAACVASVTYQVTDAAFRAHVKGVGAYAIVDEFVDDHLVEEKPERIALLVELDLQVFGGTFRRRTACPMLLALFRAQEAEYQRQQARQAIDDEIACRFEAGDFPDWPAAREAANEAFAALFG